MGRSGIIRIAAGLAVAAIALGLAIANGSNLGSALSALLGGGLAALIAWPAGKRFAAGDQWAASERDASLPDAVDLIESVDTPLLVVRDRHILLANQAARDLLGDHIQGVDVRLAIRHPAAVERLTADHPERVVKADLVGIGEHDRPWEMTATRLKDGGRVVRLIDTSAIHSAEQMRADFVANASHELRTPLATLLGFLETLQDEPAAEDKALRTRFLRIMFDEARRMHHLVDDLISLSRIESERFVHPQGAVDLFDIAQEVRRACAHVAEDRGSDIVLERQSRSTRVMGDPPQLRQLMQNLVGNALKYGRAGTPVIVRFGEAGSDMLRLSVVDQGEGIAPQHLPRLTERFYRVDPSRSREMGGTGLGLAIVKHIVGRHRGRLEIRSKPGEGTTVQVDLPLDPR